MVGQEELLKKINTYTLDNFPKSALFIGDIGSGRRTISKYISGKFNLEYVEINSKNMTREEFTLKISECHYVATPTLYLIDLDDCDIARQNLLLKLVEEPSYSVFIILIARSELSIIETIRNRCIKFSLNQYTEAQLKEISLVEDELAYKLCKTPGQILSVDTAQFKLIFNTCESLIKNLDRIETTQLLKIVSQINFKDNYTKYDFNLFLSMLEYLSVNDYIENNNKNSLKIKENLVLFKKNLLYKGISKENFMYNFLLNLKRDG